MKEMETTPEEVAAIIFDTDLAQMLPPKELHYEYTDLIGRISADINTHHASAERTAYNKNNRLKWLIEKIHSELGYYCPKERKVDIKQVLASAGFGEQ